MKISPYLKAVVAAVTAGLIALQTAISHGTLTGSDWITVALAVLGAVAVYYTPNRP